MKRCPINYFQAKEKKLQFTYLKKDKIIYKKPKYKKELFLVNKTFLKIKHKYKFVEKLKAIK